MPWKDGYTISDETSLADGDIRWPDGKRCAVHIVVDLSVAGGPEGGDWADHIIAGVRDSQARGVISFLPKFCEPHMFYYPHLRTKLADAGIPLVLIETEHDVLALQGIRTRLQAMVETFQGGQRWRKSPVSSA